jgi:hypothetical protein
MTPHCRLGQGSGDERHYPLCTETSESCYHGLSDDMRHKPITQGEVVVNPAEIKIGQGLPAASTVALIPISTSLTVLRGESDGMIWVLYGSRVVHLSVLLVSRP